MTTKALDLSYNDAIEQVMLNNGYFAPLKLLYSEIWKYKDRSKITGKTPNRTIQERVQRHPKLQRIGLGVYALSDKIHLLEQQDEPATKKERIATRHGEMQGMLLEIGNSRREVYGTYTNDKKFVFQNKALGNLATLRSVPLFTYKRIVESVTFADVIWFNEREFPSKIFEVESSTNFRDAFVRFMELQDFRVEFICVFPSERQGKFEKEVEKSAFRPIRDRIKFYSYEQVESDYRASLHEIYI